MKRKVKNKIAVILFFACIISLFPVHAYAAAGNSRTLRVGFFAFDGYHVQDGDGNRSGYGYDFLQLLARYGDWTYEYVGYDKSWAEMQDMLADGEIDLLTSAQKTPEREDEFAFSDQAIGTSSIILTVRSGDTRYTAGDYATYNGIRVGLLKNSSRNEKLNKFAAEKGFSFTPVYYDTADEMTEALQNASSIDAILSSNLRSIQNEWILDTFAPSDFYVMVRRDDSGDFSHFSKEAQERKFKSATGYHNIFSILSALGMVSCCRTAAASAWNGANASVYADTSDFTHINFSKIAFAFARCSLRTLAWLFSTAAA